MSAACLRFHFALFLVSCLSFVQAQNFNGLNNSSYLGVYGIDNQPASIVDSRLKMDVGIFGFGLNVANNYLAYKSIYKWKGDIHDLTNENNSASLKSVFLDAQVMLPSFMYQFKDRSAFAITANIREVFSLTGVGQPLAKLSLESYDYEPLWNQYFRNDGIKGQNLNYIDIGLTYGREVYNRKQHFAKAAVRPKLLLGISGLYAALPTAEYLFYNDEEVSLKPDSRMQYGFSSNFDFDKSELFYQITAQPGFAADFGGVYEWRPKYYQHQYEMDGDTARWAEDEDKYKLRVGFSVTDLGVLTFKNKVVSNEIVATPNSILTNAHEWNTQTVDVSLVREISDTLLQRFGLTGQNKKFSIGLPAAFSFQADYALGKGLYIGLVTKTYFRMNETGTRAMDNYTLTPRYDRKRFGVGIPLSFNQFGQFHMGLALRVGPLVVGTNTLDVLFTNIYNANVYFGVHIPILNKRAKDKDKDKVSDKKDDCDETAGPFSLNGCPDKDNDGIPDKEDRCPTEPGLAKYFGCPDKDGDGIIDSKDKCPDVAGLRDFDGCPDTDKDEIPDFRDDCPDKPGPYKFNGCPDTDGDGLPDSKDKCPTEAGPDSLQGCPPAKPVTVVKTDTVAASQPVLPETPTAVETVAEVLPPEKDNVLYDLLANARSNTVFEFDSDILQGRAQKPLKDLAAYLKKRNELVVELRGHTDSFGSDSVNLDLSKRRAQAVKNFLIQNGVEEKRISADGFGETQPIETNQTAAGRAINRRVEYIVKIQ